jgi:hypothetical protein
MTLADVLAVLTGLAIAGAGFACFAMILATWAPGALERVGARAGRPGRALSIGLLLLLTTLTVVGGLLKAGGPAPLLGVAIVVFDLALAALGGAGLAVRLAQRVRAHPSGALSTRDLLRGVFLLEGAALLPIVGWLLVFPFLLLVSLGAGASGLLGRGPRVGTVEAAAPRA